MLNQKIQAYFNVTKKINYEVTFMRQPLFLFNASGKLIPRVIKEYSLLK